MNTSKYMGVCLLAGGLLCASSAIFADLAPPPPTFPPLNSIGGNATIEVKAHVQPFAQISATDLNVELGDYVTTGTPGASPTIDKAICLYSNLEDGLTLQLSPAEGSANGGANGMLNRVGGHGAPLLYRVSISNITGPDANTYHDLLLDGSASDAYTFDSGYLSADPCYGSNPVDTAHLRFQVDLGATPAAYGPGDYFGSLTVLVQPVMQ